MNSYGKFARAAQGILQRGQTRRATKESMRKVVQDKDGNTNVVGHAGAPIGCLSRRALRAQCRRPKP